MKQVIMLGPAPASRGGMASVVATLLAHGYEDGNCRFIATQVDGGRARKAAQAAIAFVHVLSLFLAGRIALLHMHVASGSSFWRKAGFMAMARLFGCPVLFHLHGGQFPAYIDRQLTGWRQRLALALIRQSAAAFALSDASAAWLRARCQLAQVEVFPNPVAAWFGPARQPGRDVLFLGRLEESKGVFELLRAFAAAALPGARLVLAGEGEGAAVSALAAQLGIGASVVLPGWVDQRQRAGLLASAAVLVLPSYQEQMPMVLLEAMAAGIPVIATSVGAIPEMLAHGKCGILLPVKDTEQLAASILRIMRDSIHADRLSACGLERVKTIYMADIVIERLRRRYEELAA
ncbi:MAG: glycosyltransferase family 4 protein [Pseudomonadota bacterium]